jgi:glycosyltransferase involved in cell wall biosynthesis
MNSTEPFISVIIPTYNRLNLLKETVDSVRSQTFRDFEIIVVDDGSKDETAEWLGTQGDIRSVVRANSGIAASRNKGASLAGGKWFAFLDHDDLWDPDKLKIQAEFAGANPDVGMITAKHVRLGPGSKKSGAGKWLKGDLFLKEYSESFIHTSSVMIRRDVFAEVRGFPTCYKFADEFDVWLKITKRYPTAYYDEALVFIRFYESNTSHNRIGVRTDTYDILLNHYDPKRVPEPVFLKVMSDHDISYGRAYLKAGDLPKALEWFKKSVERTPRRLRSLRYYLRYLIMSKFKSALAIGRRQSPK